MEKHCRPQPQRGFLHAQGDVTIYWATLPLLQMHGKKDRIAKGWNHGARSTYPCPQKAFVMPYQPHIGYGVSFLETKEIFQVFFFFFFLIFFLFSLKTIFQVRTYIHMKTIPGGNTRELPIFQEAAQLFFSILLHFLEGKQIYRTAL